MTDRVSAFIVTLAKDRRDDEIEHILNALRMVSGVLKVEPLVSTWESHMAESRAKSDLGQRVLDAVRREIREASDG